MRIWPALMLLFAAAAAPAQVTVTLYLPQEQFLRDQSLPVAVRIENRTGQTLELGKTANWLRFSLETRDHQPVRLTQPLGVVKPFKIESSAAATKYLDLMPSYDLGRPGRYRVQALVQVPGWEQPFVSQAEGLTIGRGVESWAQLFGLPGKESANGEVRRYSLLQANYGKRPKCFVRVADRDNQQVYGVVSLGPVVSFSRPEKIIDGKGRLHVLFQNGARSFRYGVVDPSAELLIRQTYSYQGSRPTLHHDEGKVEVAGGVRRLSLDDLPTSDVPTASNNADSPSP